MSEGNPAANPAEPQAVNTEPVHEEEPKPIETEKVTIQVKNMDPVDRVSHERVLYENRKYKSRAQEAEAKIKTLEESRLQEEGKFKELYQTRDKELIDLRSQIQKKEINQQAMNICHRFKAKNPNLVIKAIDWESVTYDEESGKVYNLEEEIKKVVESDPYLFENQSQSVVNTAVPGGELRQTKVTSSNYNSAPQQMKDDYFKEGLRKHFTK